MYGEVIALTNMLFNYAVLSFANKISDSRITLKRLLFASFMGAVPVAFFPASSLAALFSFGVMTVVAFGVMFARWKKAALLVVIGAILAGGFLTAFHVPLFAGHTSVTVLLSAAGAYTALGFMKRKWLDMQISGHLAGITFSSQLEIWNREMEVDVFIDSGNACTEPVSGAPVHFVSIQAVQDAMPPGLYEQLLTWDASKSASLSSFTQEEQRKMRLIRVMTVHGQSWAIGFKYDRWVLEGGETLQPGYIVFTEKNRRYPEGAKAILHVSVLETIRQERGPVHAV